MEAKRKRPKVAVVLSGGGAKGVAHISALRAIEEAGIPIDIVCGTSMGSLIGGLYAIGWSTDELDSLVRTQDWLFLLTDRANPEALDIDTRRIQNTYALWHAFSMGGERNQGAGVIRGVNLDRLFDRLLEGYLDSINFDTLPIPFACVATDIVTGDEIDFRSGHLKKAMRASMSIPGVFTPVRMDDRLLVDGGVANNYPADLARCMGADIIIGVTVQGDTLSADDITNALDVILQIIDNGSKERYRNNIEMSDLVMHVDVSGYSAASFTTASIDTLLRRGREEALRHSDELAAIARRITPKGDPTLRPLTESEQRRDAIQRRRAEKRDALALQQSTSLSLSSPSKQLLYHPIVGVAFRFDNEETGALQIGARIPIRWILPQEISLSLRLGKRFQFYIEQALYPRGITSPTIAYTYRRNDIDIFTEGVRSHNVKYNQHIVTFRPINSIFRKYKVHAGIRYDYFDFYDPILSSGSSVIVLDNQHFFSYYLESFLNTEDDWDVPTSGMYLLTTYQYHTDNFFRYQGGPGIKDFRIHWRQTFSPHRIFAFQTSLYGRAVFSESETPLIFNNALGSHQEIVEQQFPFPGVYSITRVDQLLVAAQLKLQFAITQNQYIITRIAAARHKDQLDLFLQDWPNLYGISIGYCFKSFLGPIEADIGHSSDASGINLYLSIGHRF